MYRITTPINVNANLSYFNAWARDNYPSLFSGTTEGQSLYIYFVSQPDEVDELAIIDFYNALTVDDVVPTAEIMPLYEQMQADGKEYFFQAKAQYFGLAFRDGLLTSANINYIYNKLAKVERRINNGDWEPALYVLQNEINTITQQDIDNGYTQAIHDSIVNDVTNYLNSLT